MIEVKDENMLAVHALGFALLLCRSENEALLVIKHFTKAQQAVTLDAERDDQHDGAGAHWR
jgi:hypothetical protein